MTACPASAQHGAWRPINAKTETSFGVKGMFFVQLRFLSFRAAWERWEGGGSCWRCCGHPGCLPSLLLQTKNNEQTACVGLGASDLGDLTASCKPSTIWAEVTSRATRHQGS